MDKTFSCLRRFLTVLVLVSVLPAGISACGKKAEPVKTRVELNSEPEGAAVFIKGVERGKTPLKGSMRPGVYLVKYSLPGYKSKWQKIELNPGDQKSFTVKLERETATVMITSSPDGAMVSFEGKNLGITPLVIPDLAHGNYTAELTRHGFNRQTASWTVSSAIPVLVNVRLDSNLGILSFDSVPRNAEVLLDGKSVGQTPFREQVEEGKHVLEIRRSGYVEVKKTVLIKSGSETTFPKLVLEVKRGSIKIESRPSKVRISIDGREYGDTPQKISNLKPGKYAVKLEKEGFDPAERNVNLPPGGNLELMFNLDSNTGGIDIVTQPAGLTLYLDGKMIGVSERNPQNERISKVFKVRNLSMGKHQLAIAHKRARPEKKILNFTIKKGKIYRPTGLNLWIPNAVVLRTDGTRETGRITQNLPDKYEFEPSPGVKYTINKNTVKKVDFLPETE